MEWQVIAANIEIVLKAGDVPLLAEVALKLVQDFDEDLEDGRGVVAADAIELLVDVEQDTSRRDGCGLAEIRLHNLIVNFRQQNVCGPRSRGEGAAVEDEREYLEKVRLARPEEA